ncbi:DgyrCDS649 [Dimorphilus gyrociliatus]|uniref:DgyrCDS649 n=1 Tax=Dimorphilus gyrociliatus TaxID=2664684 RepID=A0A7I8V6J8_9ANNE|nr:DgyrCDS649 [Dimorphilus gyrociliatus]
MAAAQNKVKLFENVLNQEIISLEEIKKLCFSGCPEEASIRATCWKLLLNYIPPETADWKSHLKKQRESYAKFIDELVQNSVENDNDSSTKDHPLNTNPQSDWNQYFKDNEMLCQIDRDCRRLSPGLAFYQYETKYPYGKIFKSNHETNPLRKRLAGIALSAEEIHTNKVGTFQKNKEIKKKAPEQLSDGEEYHWEVVERILFVYTKLNKGQGYVQGMNEVIGPLYYTFATDPDQSGQENAEADTFWCFMNLMSEVRDNFIKSLDESKVGITHKMQQVMEVLEKIDTPLYIYLTKNLEVKPQYFCFRWITVLLTQEFDLPNVVRIWDSLLSHEKRFDFLIYICCAMLKLIRGDILKKDFTAALKTLQVRLY